MEDKDFIKVYEKIVDEQNDIMEKTSKIKSEVDALQSEYVTCTENRKNEIMQRLEKLNDELETLEKRSIKNSKRAQKLKSIN